MPISAVRLFLLLLAALPLASLSACGSDKAGSPVELTPRSAAVYGEATFEPEGKQKEAVEALVRKLPGSGTSEERIDKLLEDASKESKDDVSYKKDVKPWLGKKAGFFVSPVSRRGTAPPAAALIETEDEDASIESFEKSSDWKNAKKASQKGVDYLRKDDMAVGTVDGYVVAGNVGGFKQAVDVADGGDSISGSDDYEKALKAAPDDRLALFYVNSPQLLKSLGGSLGGAAVGPFRRLLGDSYVATVDADANGVELTATLPPSYAAFLGPFFGRGTALLRDLPADSWAAVGQPALGKLVEQYVALGAATVGSRETIERQLRQATGLDLDRDVTGWMGDFGLFVRGTRQSNLNGALVIKTSDQRRSKRALDALERILRRQGDARVRPLSAPGGGDGFTARSSAPQPIHVFQRGDRVVAAYGDAAAADAVDPRRKLGDAEDFKAAARALGGGFPVSTYVAIEPILELAENEGAARDSDYRRAKPYLEALGALVSGAKKRGDKLDSRSRLTVP